MRSFIVTRPTIADAPQGETIEQWKSHIPDAALRRHLSCCMDFDFRAGSLEPIPDHWDEQVKALHRASQASTIEGLVHQFGKSTIESKIENFKAIGTKPMSVLSYHNAFFEQVRNAYVMGQYYPALVGSCALGERILNHLILDMRTFFTATPEYKRVHGKSSFDNWDTPIDILEAWGILLPPATSEFRALKTLRHRSIHFNAGTYSTLKEDSLASILHMRTIIEQQFSSFADRPWFIRGTLGQAFIRKSFENHPFVKTYFVPLCPFVGPLFGMGVGENGAWEVYDVPDYGDGTCTDEEFAALYNERDPETVLKERPTIQRVY